MADKIRDEDTMHILTLAGNTIGIEAAKAIGIISIISSVDIKLIFLLPSENFFCK